MAYYNKEDEENQIPLEQLPAGPQGSQVIGEGMAGGASPAQAEAQKPEVSSGAAGGTAGGQGSFAGISDYINANKAQSAKLAGQVGGYVNQLGDTARSQLTEQQSKYNQVVDQNTINLNQQLVDQAKQDATRVAAEQAKLQEFQKMRDAEYKGPTSFEGSDFFQPAAKAVDAAKQAAANTATQEGQRTLLARLQNQQRGRVNTGATTFDQALLQADPEARAALAAVREKQSDLASLLEGAKSAGLSKAQKAAQTTAATRQAIQSQFTGDNSPQAILQRVLQDRAGQLQSESTRNREQLMSDLSQGRDLSDYQLGLLGVNRDQWNQLQNTRNQLKGFGVDALQNIAAGATGRDPAMSINAQNVANAEEYARWAALNQLMGTSNSFLSDPSQAGRYDLDSVDFNYGGVNDFLTGALSAEQTKEAERVAAEQARIAQEEADRRARERQRATEEEQRRIAFDAAGTAAFGPVGGIVADALWRNGAKDLSTHGAQVTLDKAGDQLSQLGQGAINTVTNPGAAVQAGINTASNAVKSVGGSLSKGAKKVFSDERLKKDVAEFDPGKFLDDLTKTKWKM